MSKIHLKPKIIPQLGFTLAEVLIVISIVSAMSFYLVQHHAKSMSRTLLDRALADVVDLKRAALNSFVSVGYWPDAGNNCVDAGLALVGFVGVIPVNPWGFDLTFACPQLAPVVDASLTPEQQESAQLTTLPLMPSFIIQQQMPSQLLAQKLARRLPSAQIRVDNDLFFVDAYVPIVLLQQTQDFTQHVNQQRDQLLFSQITCPIGETPEVVLVPNQVCSQRQAFTGYQLQAQPVADSNGLYEVIFNVFGEGGVRNGFQLCNVATPEDAVGVFQFCTRV